MQTKICTVCGIEQTLDMFHKDKQCRLGVHSRCKKCCAIYDKQRYEQNGVRNSQEYKQNNGKSKYNASYYRLNRDKISTQKKEYYEQNREVMEQKRNAKKEKMKPYFAAYRKLNRAYYNNYWHKRNALAKTLPATLTKEQWEQAKKYFDDKCCYCGKELPLAQDHFIPLIKNGGYTADNIVPACTSCNASKNDSDFFKWYPRQKYYNEEREIKILDYLMSI